MSKPRVIPDAERTATMVDLVRQQYPAGNGVSLSHVVVEEVAPSTGWSGTNRWADMLALSVWPSKGLTLDGYEIKASRADLKRELADPKKHQALARYCDTWSLVVWDESVLVDGIPDTWGIYITAPDDDYGRVLDLKRKATKATPDSWPRGFVCSLVRNAYEQAPGAAYLARAVASAAEHSGREGLRQGKAAAGAWLEPIRRILFGADRWNWPPEAHDPEKVCALAAERLTQGELELRAGGVLGSAPTMTKTKAASVMFPPFMGHEMVLLAPGVYGVTRDEADGTLVIVMVLADAPGSGDVGRYLDALPTNRRVIVEACISPRLMGMLERRGFVWRPDATMNPDTHEVVDGLVRGERPAP